MDILYCKQSGHVCGVQPQTIGQQLDPLLTTPPALPWSYPLPHVFVGVDAEVARKQSSVSVGASGCTVISSFLNARS